MDVKMDGNRKYKIVFTDYDYEKVGIEQEKAILNELDCEIVELQRDEKKKLLAECRGTDALMVELAPITKGVIDNLDRCRVISRSGIGVDKIDVEAAAAKGIPVCNVPDYCFDEVADHSLTLILCLGRKILSLLDSIKKGVAKVSTARPMLGFQASVLGLVGFGNIAQNLYTKAGPIFKEILVHDPYIRDDVLKEYSPRTVSFDELLRESDFISVHCPLTDGTHHLFNERAFKLMKPTSYLVNTSRGGIIDERALYRALIDRQIAGAGLDVLEKEPISPDDELLKLNNVIVTPHSAFYSGFSLSELKRKSALNILRVLKGQEPVNVVNPDYRKAG